MKIQLAHHYWKNRENSVWNPSRFPFPEIEQKLKQSYVILEDGRPKWRKYGDITVFFDYRPTKDVFGRDIVPISFAFVPDCLNPEACFRVLAGKLAKAPESQLELDVEFPKGSVAKTAKKHYWPFASVACAFLLLLVFWGFSGNDKMEKVPDKVAPIDIKSAYTKLDEASEAPMDSVENNGPPDEKLPQESDSQRIASEKNAKSGSQENESGRKTTQTKRQQERASARAWICANPSAAFTGQNIECAALFVKAVCGGQIAGGTDFEKWASSGASEKCRRNRQWNISKNLDTLIENELNRIKSNGKKSE